MSFNPTRRRVILCGIAAEVMALGFAGGAAQAKLTERQAAARPPNILFVLADQWRFEAFGYAGNPDVKTPKNLPKYSRLQGRLDATLNRKLEERHDNFLPGDAYIKQWGYKVDANGSVPYKP
ncbi:MAG TPA: hypothetical protein VIL39_02695 [Verrucomicrobiae bacterium]